MEISIELTYRYIGMDGEVSALVLSKLIDILAWIVRYRD